MFFHAPGPNLPVSERKSRKATEPSACHGYFPFLQIISVCCWYIIQAILLQAEGSVFRLVYVLFVQMNLRIPGNMETITEEIAGNVRMSS